MRLIVSVDALAPSLTGIGRYTWELVSRLQHAPGIRQLRFFRNERWIKVPGDLLEPQGTLQNTPAWAPSSRWLRRARKVYWNTTCRYNVFHAPNYFLPPYARNGVVTVHDLSVFRYPESHPIERVRHFEQSFQQTLSIASRLITDSETVKAEVIAQFGWPAGLVTAVPLGVSADYHPRPADSLEPVLARLGLSVGGYTLCVSTVEPRKRIGALLDAYRALPKSVSMAWPLVLAGGAGWHTEAIFAQIESAKAEGWLKYLGYLPAVDMPLLYAGARLFVYPSIYEGFGLPVAEAMASGVPVLTSNRSCLPEVADGAACLVDPDDVDTFSAAIEMGLTDEAWRAWAAGAGLSVAARYSWDRCVDATLAVYEAALNH